MLSENDTDTEMTEAEPAPQQSDASTSQSVLVIPTLTPSSQEQSTGRTTLQLEPGRRMDFITSEMRTGFRCPEHLYWHLLQL
jgi:hypothetical protein